jgi:hypothetical protein
MGTVQYNWKLPRSCQLLCGITVAPLLRERVFAHAMTSLMLDYYKTMLAPVLCSIFATAHGIQGDCRIKTLRCLPELRALQK